VRRAALGVAAAIAFLVAACSGTLQTASGIVLQVTGTSVSDISSFVLRTNDGTLITFEVGPVTFDQQSFPPEHLREHQRLALPVLVTYQVQNGQDVALKLEDAPK